MALILFTASKVKTTCKSPIHSLTNPSSSNQVNQKSLAVNHSDNIDVFRRHKTRQCYLICGHCGEFLVVYIYPPFPSESVALAHGASAHFFSVLRETCSLSLLLLRVAGARQVYTRVAETRASVLWIVLPSHACYFLHLMGMRSCAPIEK